MDHTLSHTVLCWLLIQYFNQPMLWTLFLPIFCPLKGPSSQTLQGRIENTHSCFHILFWGVVFFFISQAIINSTITPNMTFTKTSQKFGQWADSRANTVYGLGFSSEHHLAKVGEMLSLSYLSFSSLCLWRACSPFLSFSSNPCVSVLGNTYTLCPNNPCVSVLGNTYTLCPNEELYSHLCVGGFFCAVLSSLSLPPSLAPLHYDDALSGAHHLI